jgi:hypothetical protein
MSSAALRGVSPPAPVFGTPGVALPVEFTPFTVPVPVAFVFALGYTTLFVEFVVVDWYNVWAFAEYAPIKVTLAANKRAKADRLFCL